LTQDRRFEVTSLLYMFLVIFSSYYILLNASNMVSYRVRGPFYFNLQAFMPLGILISVVVFLLLLRKLEMCLASPVVFLYMCFLLKIAVVYFVFNGNVNYDTPLHYTSALYLQDYGINPSYYYHSWPSGLILVDTMRIVTGFSYPLDASIVAVPSRFLIPLTVYALALRAFNSRKLGVLALSVLIVFEPFILHYCPQIIGVAVYMVFIYALSLIIVKGASTHISILVPVILFTSLLTYHAMLPVSATLVIIVYPLLLAVLSRLQKKRVSTSISLNHMPYLRDFHYLTIFTLLGVLVYSLFITLFVTRSVIRTVELLLSGEVVRLDVYDPKIRSPDLVWQYSIIGSVNRFAIIFLLGIPSVYILYEALRRFIRGSASLHDYFLLFMVLVSGLNTGIYILTTVIQTGLTGRYFQVGTIFTSILSAYFYKALSTLESRRSFIKAILILFTIALIVFSALSIFTASSYQSIYLWTFDDKEVFMAKWVANNIDNTIMYLDGASRLNRLIVYYAYPSRIYNVNIFVTSHIDDAVLNGAKYPKGILVTATPLSHIKTSWKYYLTDIVLKEYFENLKYNGDTIFNGDTYLYVSIPS